MTKRYCQRCGKPKAVFELGTLITCSECKGTDFAVEPKKHASYKYSLTDADRDFLRTNRIDPEDD